MGIKRSYYNKIRKIESIKSLYFPLYGGQRGGRTLDLLIKSRNPTFFYVTYIKPLFYSIVAFKTTTAKQIARLDKNLLKFIRVYHNLLKFIKKSKNGE